MKLHQASHDNPDVTRYVFHCPGCECCHIFDVRRDGRGPSWTFNGDMDRPTVSPSILVRGTKRLTQEQVDRIMAGETIEPVPMTCHLFLRNGRIEFLADCDHALAGQTVDLPEF